MQLSAKRIEFKKKREEDRRQRGQLFNPCKPRSPSPLRKHSAPYYAKLARTRFQGWRRLIEIRLHYDSMAETKLKEVQSRLTELAEQLKNNNKAEDQKRALDCWLRRQQSSLMVEARFLGIQLAKHKAEKEVFQQQKHCSLQKNEWQMLDERYQPLQLVDFTATAEIYLAIDTETLEDVGLILINGSKEFLLDYADKAVGPGLSNVLQVFRCFWTDETFVQVVQQAESLKSWILRGPTGAKKSKVLASQIIGAAINICRTYPQFKITVDGIFVGKDGLKLSVALGLAAERIQEGEQSACLLECLTDSAASIMPLLQRMRQTDFAGALALLAQSETENGV